MCRRRARARARVSPSVVVHFHKFIPIGEKSTWYLCEPNRGKAGGHV